MAGQARRLGTVLHGLAPCFPARQCVRSEYITRIEVKVKGLKRTKKAAFWAAFLLFLLGVVEVCPSLFVVFLQRELLARIFLVLVVEASVVDVAFTNAFGVTLRNKFY